MAGRDNSAATAPNGNGQSAQIVTPDPILDNDDDLAATLLSGMTNEDRVAAGLEPIEAPTGEAPAAQPALTTPAQSPQSTDTVPEGETLPPELTAMLEQATADVETPPAPEPTPEPVADPAAPATQPNAGDGQGGDGSPMIPKARFDEMLNRAYNAERTAAYLKGQVDALAASGGNGAGQGTPEPTTPPEPTPEQRLAEIDTRLAELSQKYNAGDLDTAEYLEAARKIDTDTVNLRIEAAVAKMAPPPPAPQPAPVGNTESLALDTATSKLEADHPNLVKLTDTDLGYLRNIAVDQAAQQGRPFHGRDEHDVYRLRSAIADLADTVGANLINGRGVQPGQPGTTKQPNPQPQPQPQPTGANAAERATKLALEATMPPNVGSAGRASDSSGVTEAQILALAAKNPAALEDIPRSVYAKHLE